MSSPPTQPSLPWRALSSLTVGVTGSLCRGFYYGLNKTEVVGLDRFLRVLDERKDPSTRTRGLITVSNHVSVIDDPLIWGVLPLKYQFTASNHRWSLASYDLCFTNKALSTFFTFGQCLPTHRAAYSKFGGPFQSTMTQAIRLLSSQPFAHSPLAASSPSASLKSPDLIDPFSSGSLAYPSTYTTNGVDTFPAPSAYDSRRHSWIHIFPEGRIHQHPDVAMRYFRWGVSRLILESEPLPEIIPIFIDGNQQCMHESREFPRFLPRFGKNITVAFGESVDGEEVFGDLRQRWQKLVQSQKDMLKEGKDDVEFEMGELSDGLKYGSEAVELRKEVTRRVRMEVLKVRRSLGYPDEDPKRGLAETWIQEGGRREGRMNDGSWVSDA